MFRAQKLWYCTLHALSLAEVFARLISGGKNGYCTYRKFEIPRNYFLNHRGFYFPEVILWSWACWCLNYSSKSILTQELAFYDTPKFEYLGISIPRGALCAIILRSLPHTLTGWKESLERAPNQSHEVKTFTKRVRSILRVAINAGRLNPRPTWPNI